MVITIFFFILLVMVVLVLGYLLIPAVASAHSLPVLQLRSPSNRFIIAIPAHNEASVIGSTVERLRRLDYPSDLFSIHIVADHCSDATAQMARQAGAVVHEREEGPRTGKGAALSWLFEQILADGCDAVVVFDSDTQVDPLFLRIMDYRLSKGDSVIQGQHVISNPGDGWFAALTWAMFLVDNRFQNRGRHILGWSAKNMGDSICFRADVLLKIGWGQGLTEDYQLRQRLLLEGIKIAYEPNAIGYGEAPPTLATARAQRARWLRGTRDASKQFASRLLRTGFQSRDAAMIDGALQAYLPSYSTLTVVALASTLLQVLIDWRMGPAIPWMLLEAWLAMIVLLIIYPFFGLALERAPIKAYLAILSGFFFVFWRTWLALIARLGRKPVIWIRTPHGERT